ncbi:MAG TPA: hypothetical protein PLD63_07625 [Ignavibacteria bacterium]|nr:hypothetical protein [Ignavibacteria bacterium]
MKKSFYIIAVLIFFVTGVSRSQIHSEKGSFLCSEKKSSSDYNLFNPDF